jgi:hypothetical protein
MADAGEAQAVVEIHEEKVFMQLGKSEASREAKVWILDSGATNHMIGSCATFIDLDRRVWGTIHFGDDSTSDIEGRGRVEFICKNGGR